MLWGGASRVKRLQFWLNWVGIGLLGRVWYFSPDKKIPVYFNYIICSIFMLAVQFLAFKRDKMEPCDTVGLKRHKKMFEYVEKANGKLVRFSLAAIGDIQKPQTCKGSPWLSGDGIKLGI